MLELPEIVAYVVEAELGKITQAERVSGGDINEAAKVTTKEGQFFVKWNSPRTESQGQIESASLKQLKMGQILEKYPEMFPLEAVGLRLLERVEEVRVPKVAVVAQNCLVLEWIEFRVSGRHDKEAQRKLGEQLARLHKHTHDKHGLGDDNYIGKLPQKNRFTECWWQFYGEQRIKPQLAIARKNGYVDEEFEERIWQLYDKLPELLPENVEASVLHGDLWGGNWAVDTSGEPVVFDPAVYCGHREMDLAMTELFGGFGKEFYKAYDEEWSIDLGYEKRKKLYQLYPLMVHLNLFGKGYLGQVEAIVESYL